MQSTSYRGSWSGVSYPAVLAVLLSAVAGCRQESIQVYEVAKEKAPERAEVASGAPQVPTLKWTKLPEGWQSREGGNRMRAASFSIAGPEGKSAELSVIPLAGMGGNDLDFVNMWRKQIGLGEVEAGALGKYMAPVKISGLEGKLFDMRGSEAAQATDPNGVLVAVLAREGVTWFFKLAGDEALVQAQRAPFIEFLQGVGFTDPDPSTRMANQGSSDEGGGAAGTPGLPNWTVPPGWTAVTPGPMVLSKFVASGDGSAKADVTVSRFPGDVGGLLANVNRWRNQVGLAPLDAQNLAKETTPLAWEGGQGTVVDVTGTDAKSGQPARLIGVIVPRNNETWFYKIMGAPAVSEQEKAPFLKFVQSAKYAQAP